MILGIDAVNIRAGGGLKHLKELLSHSSDLSQYGIDWLYVFVSSKMEDIHTPERCTQVVIKRFGNSVANFFLQRRALKKEIQNSRCDLLFCPGGTGFGGGIPYISMSQNMLVFEKKERDRFPLFHGRLRYLALEYMQAKYLSGSAGNVFISDYAFQYISDKYPAIKQKDNAVIPLGASDKFSLPPRKQMELEAFKKKGVIKLLYVSIVNFYKHQHRVIDAVERLRTDGYPVELTLIGTINPALKDKIREKLKGKESYIQHLDRVGYETIHTWYHDCDIFVFASSCENMPNILVEAMSAGLPIACSNYGPMPEILKDAGEYFNPESSDSLYQALVRLISSAGLRQKYAERAFALASAYTWERCSKETFAYIQRIGSIQH